MKAKVTEQGITIPKELLEGMDEVEVYREDGRVVIVPAGMYDRVYDIGKNPVDGSITDGSVNHDFYIYNGK